MNVDQILTEKGREVVTVAPAHSLSEVARMLAARRIGAAVVSDASQAVLGIVSERDIVRALAEGGPAALEDEVSGHMTVKVVTCSRQTAVEELMELMTEGRFRHVPVVEEGRLIGIVSIGDVVKRRVAQIENEHRAMRDYIATA